MLFPFGILKLSFCSLLASIVSIEKLAVSLIVEGIVFYPLVVFMIFCLFLVWGNFAVIFLGISFFEFVQLEVYRTF